MRITRFCLALFLSLTSCKKDKLDVNLFWQCHMAQNSDSTAISNKLIGSWTWTKRSCDPTGEVTQPDKNIKLTFKGDHTFSILENSNVLTSGTWKIKQLGANEWGLDASSPSQYLAGRILFCDNQVLFNDSYVDGCDNLFDKVN